MTRFWISWVQPTDDHRPLNFPPGPAILGWWCSGYDSRDRSILCALIECQDAESIRETVAKDWPEVMETEWRFCEERPRNWLPNDRFQPSPWMAERMKETAP